MARSHLLATAAIALPLSGLARPAAAQLAQSAPLASGASRQRVPDRLHVIDIGHGFGQLLPHRIAELDALGQPTGAVLDVRDLETLAAHSTPTNPLLPAPSWPATAALPGGLPGNHFLIVRFDAAPNLDFILTAEPSAAATDQLLGTLQVIGTDPLTGATLPVRGRAFVGGRTYAGTPVGVPPQLPLQTWVTPGPSGPAAAAGVDNDNDGVADGIGFPGTEGAPFAGAELLALPNAFVFVADTDGDLRTHETFPMGLTLSIEVSSAIHALSGVTLEESARVAATVGPDTLAPELRLSAPPQSAPDVQPALGDQNVDPLTSVTLGFLEPLEPWSVGPLAGVAPAGTSPALQLAFGPAAQRTQVPFTVRPVSAWDLTRYTLEPAFPFPGGGPTGCGSFSRIDVTLQPGSLRDLAANTNQLGAASFFEVGAGPGLVNAPVTPDAIYVGRSGARVGLSVIDLNGFGAGTGDPTYDVTQPVQEGHSNYPNNPNLRFQGSLLQPPLAPGSCTVNGGSAGVFTLTRDSNLDDLCASSPILQGASDLALGASLDQLFSNGPAPFGCQSGGGNLCALDGLAVLDVTLGGPSTLAPTSLGGTSLHVAVGAGNPVSFAPHPNPPPLSFPPLCVAPHLGGAEPTSIVSAGLVNLLVPGDPFGDPSLQIPPSGLLSPEQNAWFQGPAPPQAQITACLPYMVRQKVGQLLYAVDRVRSEVVVLDSNRMTPLERIALADPTELAVSPSLDLLAVTNQATGTVDFIDIAPGSASFHEIVHSTGVGASPRGVAWDPGNEDILVCNEADGTLSVISAFSLDVRKTLSTHLTQPFAVAMTQRQASFGTQRNVSFAYVLNRNGGCAIYESGPDGVNGWGYDDIIGRAPYAFRQPKAIQPDPTRLDSAVWIAHEGQIDLLTGLAGPVGTPALSRLGVLSSVSGVQPLTPGSAPQFRNMTVHVDASLGAATLSGLPTDLAFDDQRNLAALPDLANPFGAGSPAEVNGKGLVRFDGTTHVPVSNPSRLFVAVPNPAGLGVGVVDVIALSGLIREDTNAFQPGVQSIPTPGVISLASYFRQ